MNRQRSHDAQLIASLIKIIEDMHQETAGFSLAVMATR